MLDCKMVAQSRRMQTDTVELSEILPLCKLKELKLTLYCQVYKAVLQDGSVS